MPTIVILAGGESSRFYPFNHHHKSLTTLCGSAILSHTVNSLSSLNFPLIVISNPQDHQTISKLTHTIPNCQVLVQPEALGQANAILTAFKHTQDNLVIVNAQHLNCSSLVSDLIKHVANTDILAAVYRTTTDLPQKYGMLKLDGDRILDIIEKPESKPPSPFRIVGIYYLTQEFINQLATLPPSEYQLEAAFAQLSKTHHLAAFETDQPTLSLKYPWDLFELKNQLLNNFTDQSIDPSATISASAQISGPVYIGPKAYVGNFVSIQGPAYIGSNAVVGDYCLVRAGSVLESHAEIQRYCELKNSIIGSGSHIHSGYLGDSIVGENCRIGAGIITANRRFDRQPIKLTVKSTPTSSQLTSLGAIIGNNSHLGIRVSLMPGTIIGPDSIVYPGTICRGTHTAKQIIGTKP